MANFSEYEKIPTDFKKLLQSTSTFNELNKLDWVVTEKVHGANFSFIYSDGKLQFAKRKELLRWNDDFFGFQLVVSRMENQIIDLFEELSKKFRAEKYILYGELFGGIYPHPDVPADLNVQPVQTGIYYSPTIHFCAFDIALERENNSEKYYLDYKTAIFYFRKYKLVHARILQTGKLDDALNFDLQINSTIPEQLNLPSIKHNRIEGIVIKPMNYSAKPELDFRPVLKIKNPEFEENLKYHQAKKWFYIPDVTLNSEELGFLLDDMKNYVTQNRLNSAISKIGSLDIHNPSRLNSIKEEFLKDILADFNNDNLEILNELTPQQSEWLQGRILKEMEDLINKIG
jgi:Rnl2 family RNA ligase